MNTIHKCFSAPIKGRSRCYASLHCKEYGHIRTWHIYNTGKTCMYRDRNRVVELLLKFENKPRIMQNNLETQHKHMYSLYIGSLCNIAFPTARFTCIVTIHTPPNLIYIIGTSRGRSILKCLM